MNQVLHINKLLAELENITSADWKNWGIPNATAADFVTWAQSRARHTIKEVLIEMTEANAEQEQPLISAEEARKLGAGNAEFFDPIDGNWFYCRKDEDYLPMGHTPRKYRAIRPQAQPEPVEPTCQVRNEDSGLTETMTREKAKLLQAELGDAVEWTNPFGQKPVNLMFKNLSFDCEGIYTYKSKANLVKLDGELMTREAAIAKYEAVKDKCDLYAKNTLADIPCESPAWHSYDDLDKHEYQLRSKPLKQVSWKDVPVGVAVTCKTMSGLFIFQGVRRVDESKCLVIENGIAFLPATSAIELAPASEQTKWIAVQNGQTGRGVTQVLQSKGFTTALHGSYEKYRITGLAEGYELK